jgi:chemotaxis protein CheD
MTLDTTNHRHPAHSETFVYKGDERRAVADSDQFFNDEFQAKPLYLEPGQTIWSEDSSTMVVATVGSGVLLSVWDENLKMGVLGYLLLADKLLEQFPNFENADGKLLSRALEPIEESIGRMKRQGAGKSRIRMRLIGGANLPYDGRDAGTKNYVFAREFITRKKLSILNEDLGGPYIRRVHFFPSTGRCVRRMLRREADLQMIRDVESEYQARLLTRL